MIDTIRHKSKGYFPRNITPAQCKDTGMALVLISLLLLHFTKHAYFLGIGVAVLVINMIAPVVYKPFAFFWLSLSNILGTVMSKVLLSIVFFVVVTPVGLVRRLLGFDPLQLKKFKKDKSSVFKVRDHAFKADEIEKPY